MEQINSIKMQFDTIYAQIKIKHHAAGCSFFYSRQTISRKQNGEKNRQANKF